MFPGYIEGLVKGIMNPLSQEIRVSKEEKQRIQQIADCIIHDASNYSGLYTKEGVQERYEISFRSRFKLLTDTVSQALTNAKPKISGSVQFYVPMIDHEQVALYGKSYKRQEKPKEVNQIIDSAQPPVVPTAGRKFIFPSKQKPFERKEEQIESDESGHVFVEQKREPKHPQPVKPPSSTANNERFSQNCGILELSWKSPSSEDIYTNQESHSDSPPPRLKQRTHVASQPSHLDEPNQVTKEVWCNPRRRNICMAFTAVAVIIVGIATRYLFSRQGKI